MPKIAPEISADDGEGGQAPPKKKKGKKKMKKTAWRETVDDTTGFVYYTNNKTGEVSWTKPDENAPAIEEVKRVYDPTTGEGFFVELTGAAAQASRQAQQAAFATHRPKPVSTLLGDNGKKIVFPNIHPIAPLVRVSVLKNMAPPRSKIVVSCGNPADEASEYWQPSMSFYAFADAMPCTLPYTIESRREPTCNRLRLQGANPQARDLTAWTPDKPIPRGFFAFPEPVPGSSPFALDWSSGPDRYNISDNPEMPELGWLRCIRFQGFAAQKYHILESKSSVTGVASYRVHRGHWCPLQEGWTCLFAFYALDHQDAPGSTPFFLQHRYEPFMCTRVAAEPTTQAGWYSDGTFNAFNVPLPGTARFSVDFMMRSTETREAAAEMSRIWAGDTWEPWLEKIYFYAFPAPTLLFQPEDLEALHEHEDSTT